MSNKAMRTQKLISKHGTWLLIMMPLMILLISRQIQICEGRYLPTRSNENDLNKLRELIVQILESKTGEEPIENSNMYEKRDNGIMSTHGWDGINNPDNPFDLDALKSMGMIRKYYDRNNYKDDHY